MLMTNPSNVPRRHLYEWINLMFNRPDLERIKLVGADRCCAEWVLKNGGKVQWKGSPLLADFNSLPPEDEHFELEVIDATDCSISHYGFDHLRNCNGIWKIILSHCVYVLDPALAGLRHAKGTLKHLEIQACHNVTEKGLAELKVLQNLKYLSLADLSGVANLSNSAANLKNDLPSCDIVTI